MTLLLWVDDISTLGGWHFYTGWMTSVWVDLTVLLYVVSIILPTKVHEAFSKYFQCTGAIDPVYRCHPPPSVEVPSTQCTDVILTIDSGVTVLADLFASHMKWLLQSTLVGHVIGPNIAIMQCKLETIACNYYTQAEYMFGVIDWRHITCMCIFQYSFWGLLFHIHSRICNVSYACSLRISFLLPSS